jgi:hypothetical protein
MKRAYKREIIPNWFLPHQMEKLILWIITSVTRNTNARAPVLSMEFASSLLYRNKKFGRAIYHLKVSLIYTSVYRINEKIARLR